MFKGLINIAIHIKGQCLKNDYYVSFHSGFFKIYWMSHIGIKLPHFKNKKQQQLANEFGFYVIYLFILFYI